MIVDGNANETTTPTETVNETIPPVDGNTNTVNENQPPVDNTAPVVNTLPAVVNENVPPVDDTVQAVNKTKNSFTRSIKMSVDENDLFETVYQYRFENNMSRDVNHMLRQMVDFAINHGAFLGKQAFGIPDDMPPRLLKDAFFTSFPNPKKLQICK